MLSQKTSFPCNCLPFLQTSSTSQNIAESLKIASSDQSGESFAQNPQTLANEPTRLVVGAESMSPSGTARFMSTTYRVAGVAGSCSDEIPKMLVRSLGWPVSALTIER